MRINFKVSILASVVFFCFFMAFSSAAFGGAVRCEVQIDLVGSTDTAGPVLVGKQIGGNCPSWGEREFNNFLITELNQNGMLAVTLTAAALNKSIYIHAIGDVFENWGTVHQVYLANDIVVSP